MEINKTFTDIETTFNTAGSIPIVAIFSGVLRKTIGLVQMVASAFLALIGLIGQMIHPDEERWVNLSNKSFDQFLHGGMNTLRGTGEFLLGLTILGPLIPLVLQTNSENKFAPIFKYDVAVPEQALSV